MFPYYYPKTSKHKTKYIKNKFGICWHLFLPPTHTATTEIAVLKYYENVFLN